MSGQKGTTWRTRPDILEMDVETARFQRYMDARRQWEIEAHDEPFDVDAFVEECLDEEHPYLERPVLKDPWNNRKTYTTKSKR